MDKKIPYHEFLMRYVNKSESFIFCFYNIIVEFSHKDKLYIVKFSDQFNKIKVLELEHPMWVNKIELNSSPIIDYWDKFKLLEVY